MTQDAEIRLLVHETTEKACACALDESRRALSMAEAIDAKLNLLLGMSGATLMAALGAFIWLFQLQQGAAAQAKIEAREVARAVVLEHMRK